MKNVARESAKGAKDLTSMEMFHQSIKKHRQITPENIFDVIADAGEVLKKAQAEQEEFPEAFQKYLAVPRWALIDLSNDRDYLDHCRVRAGMAPAVGWVEHVKRIAGAKSYEALALTEWCPEFEALMRAALIMGGLRYGLLGDIDKHPKDYVSAIRWRVMAYQSSGNTAFLVDIANCALCEFVLRGGVAKMVAIDGDEAEKHRINHKERKEHKG